MKFYKYINEEKVETAKYYIKNSAENFLDGNEWFTTIEDFYSRSLGVAIGWMESLYDYKDKKFDAKVEKVHDKLLELEKKPKVPAWFKKEFKDYLKEK